jgi:hypothetical protein
MAASAASAATFALRASFVDHQRPAEKFLSVQSRDGLFSLRVVLDLREAKAARLPGEAIAKQSQRIRLHARFRK